MGLSPLAGFDWTLVGWGAPDEPVSETCSYCDTELTESHVPLILWNPQGWCARFCEACMVKWWGFDPLPDDDDDDYDEPGEIPS